MKVLILHNIEDVHKARLSAMDYLLSFEREAQQNQYAYWRTTWPVTDELKQTQWDAVIFTSTALGIVTIQPHERFKRIAEDWAFLRGHGARKIVIPQDDADHGQYLDEFFQAIGADYVFTVRPEHRELIYPKTSKTAKFESTFSGFLDTRTVEEASSWAKPFADREITIGQRVTLYGAHGGRLARLKGEAALAVKAAAISRGIDEDISVDPNNVLNGTKWYAFLGNCKFVIGAEGGLGIWDPRGEVQAAVRAYQDRHPSAGFEEIERACFPGLDGNPDFPGFSPRILEAAMLGCCQILVRGGYRDVLQPDVHYIPLERDFSNMNSVFAKMRDSDYVESLIANCRRDLIESDRFRYSTNVSRVLSAGGADSVSASPEADGDEVDLAPPVDALLRRGREEGVAGANLLNSVVESVSKQYLRPYVEGGACAEQIAELVGLRWGFAGLARELERIKAAATRDENRLLIEGQIRSASAAADVVEVQIQHVSGLEGASSEIDAGAWVRGVQSLWSSHLDQYLTVLERLDEGELHEDVVRGRVIGELANALAIAGAAVEGLSGRLSPDDGKAYSERELKQLAVLDRLLIRSVEGGAAFEELERYQQLPQAVREVFERLRGNGDLWALVQALVQAPEATTGLVSRLKPDGGEAFSEAELQRIGQLDRVLVRSGGEHADLGWVERLQEAPGGVRAALAQIVGGGDLRRLVQALAEAGSGTAGLVSRLAPPTDAGFDPEQLQQLERIDRLVVRAAEGGTTLAELEQFQVLGGGLAQRLALDVAEQAQHLPGDVREAIEANRHSDTDPGYSQALADVLGNLIGDTKKGELYRRVSRVHRDQAIVLLVGLVRVFASRAPE